MPCNRFLLLHKNRSCIKLRFHDTEGLFNSPKIMVCSINCRGRHSNFWCYNHVISCQLFCVFYCIFVYFHFDFPGCFFSFSISRKKGDIFCAVSIFGFLCFTCPESFCFFYLPIDFMILLFGQFWMECYNTFFC